LFLCKPPLEARPSKISSEDRIVLNKNEFRMQSPKITRPIDSKIALCGASLMVMGVAISAQLHLDNPANAVIADREAREVLPLVPSIAGACLIFLASTRISLTARRSYLLVFGFVFLIMATALPFAAARLFPAMNTYHWALSSLLPLFVLRIIGLIFLSTALLRLLVGKKDQT
jgi:hypothetical protein